MRENEPKCKFSKHNSYSSAKDDSHLLFSRRILRYHIFSFNLDSMIFHPSNISNCDFEIFFLSNKKERMFFGNYLIVDNNFIER